MTSKAHKMAESEDEDGVVMDIIGNVLILVSKAENITKRITSNFSNLERIPRYVESISTRLPLLVEVVKQAEAYAKLRETTDSQREKLLDPIEDSAKLLKALEKIVPKASTSPHETLKAQQLLDSIEENKSVSDIAGRLESHFQTLKSLLRQRTRVNSNRPVVPVPTFTKAKDFDKIEEEYEAQLRLVEDMNSSPVHWTGKSKERYDLDYDADLLPDMQRQVNESYGVLGKGNFGFVKRIVLQRYGEVPIVLAKKTIHQSNIDKIKQEIRAAQKLEGHDHIVRFLGAYQKTHDDGDAFINILIFPVANCDFKNFLESCEQLGTDIQATRDKAWHTIMDAGALDFSEEIGSRYRGSIPKLLKTFLKRTLGCMAQALAWIHQAEIAHYDLKPANILLRNGHLSITDFGIARDRSGEANTFTEFAPGHTRGFEAPEIRKQEKHSPYRADVYSLGCIFMHIVTIVYLKQSLTDCTGILAGDHCTRESLISEYIQQGRYSDNVARSSIRDRRLPKFETSLNRVCSLSVEDTHNAGLSPRERRNASIEQHQSRYPASKTGTEALELLEDEHDEVEFVQPGRLPEALRDLICFMLRDDRYERPPISDVNDWLYVIGRPLSTYHGACCPRSKHPPSFSTEHKRWWNELSCYWVEEYFGRQIRLLQNLTENDSALLDVAEDFQICWRQVVQSVYDRVGESRHSDLHTITRVMSAGEVFLEASICAGTEHDLEEIKSKALALSESKDHHHHILRLVGTDHVSFGSLKAAYIMTYPVTSVVRSLESKSPVSLPQTSQELRGPAADLAKALDRGSRQSTPSTDSGSLPMTGQGPRFTLSELAQKKLLEERRQGNARAVEATSSIHTGSSESASDTDYLTSHYLSRDGGKGGESSQKIDEGITQNLGRRTVLKPRIKRERAKTA